MTDALVIDDDPVMSRVLAAVLEQGGLRPVVSTTGAAALEALEHHDIGVVCLDVMLPDTSGEDLLVRLRTSQPDVPVIMLSAQDSVERAVEIMKLRPFDYFVKPIVPERLLRRGGTGRS